MRGAYAHVLFPWKLTKNSVSYLANFKFMCESRFDGQTQQRFGERSLPRHILDSARESTWKGRGRPPKKRENSAEDYPSAIVGGSVPPCYCLPSGSKQGVLRYGDSDFRVLARCRSKHHLNILEAMYILVLKPVLCKQKSFVANLTVQTRTQHTGKHTEWVCHPCSHKHTIHAHSHNSHYR